MLELRISKSYNTVIISVKVNGQYVDSRTFHKSEMRDMLIYLEKLIKSVVRE